MPDGSLSQTVDVLSSIADVDAAEWDACAGDGDPFTTHGFLAALEDSGAVAGSTGWLPRHLALRDGDGVLAACAPLYLKAHSFGEYVFDWGWADAYERAGGRYYPKLQSAVPFTPVPGRRLFVRPGAPPAAADALATAMVQVADRLSASSVHVTFASEAECLRLQRLGFLLRIGQQFHWHNRGYSSFDDFLDDLASRKRKAIRKERRGVAEEGVALRTLVGRDIEERHWDAFYAFYCDTHDRKWGHAYLPRAFFSLLGERMRDRIVLVIAEDGRRQPVAGALNLLGREALYGRYWGCVEDFRFLHFEACYYRAIDYAIEHGLDRVEAGAQGPHKVQRGYLPVATFSAHWIGDPRFREAVSRFLDAERAQVREDIEALSAASPFRKESEAGS